MDQVALVEVLPSAQPGEAHAAAIEDMAAILAASNSLSMVISPTLLISVGRFHPSRSSRSRSFREL